MPGEQYAAQDAPQFGFFLDSAPDRWRRLLMERRETHAARRERRQARALDDWDFLLGMPDARFAPDGTGRAATAARRSTASTRR